MSEQDQYEQYDEVLSPTNWSDPDERNFALDHYEAEYAEALYTSETPPSIGEYVAAVSLAVPEIGEPEMPIEIQGELAARCQIADAAIASDITEYEHWRNIKTAEDRRAARDRRARARAAGHRWRQSEFADGHALAEMIDALNEIDAEKAERGAADAG